jgi:hypothetical protein
MPNHCRVCTISRSEDLVSDRVVEIYGWELLAAYEEPDVEKEFNLKDFAQR